MWYSLGDAFQTTFFPSRDNVEDPNRMGPFQAMRPPSSQCGTGEACRQLYTHDTVVLGRLAPEIMIGINDAMPVSLACVGWLDDMSVTHIAIRRLHAMLACPVRYAQRYVQCRYRVQYMKTLDQNHFVLYARDPRGYDPGMYVQDAKPHGRSALTRMGAGIETWDDLLEHLACAVPRAVVVGVTVTLLERNMLAEPSGRVEEDYDIAAEAEA